MSSQSQESKSEKRRYNITDNWVEITHTPGWYADDRLRGFYLFVRESGRKYFVVNGKVRGSKKNATVTIGEYGKVPDWLPAGAETSELKAAYARILAHKAVGLLHEGINPNEQRELERQRRQAENDSRKAEEMARSVTLLEVFERYLEVRKPKSTTTKVYGYVVKSCFKEWLDLPLCTITKAMVVEKHETLSVAHKGQADHAMRILRALFRFSSVEYENEHGQPVFTTNPVQKLSAHRLWNRPPRRETLIEDHQLRAWIGAVNRLPNPLIRDYLLVLLFTGLRKNEGASLLWAPPSRDEQMRMSEQRETYGWVDLKAKYLVIREPKNGREHMLPMSAVVHSIFLRLWQIRSSRYVFSGARPDAHLVDIRIHTASIGEASGTTFTLHDLRRTFLTAARDEGYEHYTIKALANHAQGADVTDGYLGRQASLLKEPMQRTADRLLKKAKLTADEVLGLTKRPKLLRIQGGQRLRAKTSSRSSRLN